MFSARAEQPLEDNTRASATPPTFPASAPESRAHRRYVSQHGSPSSSASGGRAASLGLDHPSGDHRSGRQPIAAGRVVHAICCVRYVGRNGLRLFHAARAEVLLSGSQWRLFGRSPSCYDSGRCINPLFQQTYAFTACVRTRVRRRRLQNGRCTLRAGKQGLWAQIQVPQSPGIRCRSMGWCGVSKLQGWRRTTRRPGFRWAADHGRRQHTSRAVW